ncbi:hypothetical protein XarbCFBP7614_02995 [Xanthomonas arboricola]|nr:hypothetical protein XarbCFBP7614_02995 [Xanthomonas arboricola]
MAARLPTKRVMDHDRLEDALFGSSGDGMERFDRTISVWRIVLVDQLRDSKVLRSQPIASLRSRSELA